MVFSLILLHLFAPLFVLLQLGLQRFSSRLEWLASLILTSGVITAVSVIGSWGWFSIYLAPLYWLLLVVTIVHSARKYDRISLYSPVRIAAWVGFGSSLVLGALAWGAALSAFAGHDKPTNPVELAFPFHDGTYLVTQGGRSSLINNHSNLAGQKFALDITRLYPWGSRAKGLSPEGLRSYAIYRRPVFSPCSGIVAFVVNNLPDHSPGQFDVDNPHGNYVAIDCAGVVVYLSHLSTGSIKVNPGDRITRATELGLVGNSGYTQEPHLHVHAERGRYTGSSSGGTPVAITFDQRFLVRNSLVWR